MGICVECDRMAAEQKRITGKYDTLAMCVCDVIDPDRHWGDPDYAGWLNLER